MANSTNTKSRRKSARTRHVVETLRRRIVGGRLAPGAQLPTRRELQHHFGVSTITVERAIRELTSDGFLEARSTRGTWVADHPPHLCRYAVVFPHGPGRRKTWTRFYGALDAAARAFPSEPRRQLVVYHDVLPHEDIQSYRRLVADVCARRLAGIIFSFYLNDFVGTPLLAQDGIPRVALMDTAHGTQLPLVYPDLGAWLQRALGHLAARGRGRVAALVSTQMFDGCERILDAIGTHGLRSERCWIQIVDAWQPEAAANSVQLLFRDGQPDRPDGLLILDEHLTDGACAGLTAAGIAVPDAVDVVAHVNYQAAPGPLAGLRRLGFDSGEILRRCIDVLDAQRDGRDVPPLTQIAPLFDEEAADTGATDAARKPISL